MLRAVDWRAYLLRQLGAVSERCSRDAERQVDIAFALYAPLACGDEFLNMLYAKRHLLAYLIARYASAVDYYHSRTVDIGRYKRESESRSLDQSTSASQSSRRADTVAQSREDSFSRHETRSTSQDYQFGRSRSRQESESRDAGYGESASRSFSESREQSQASEDGRSQSQSTGFVTNWDTTCSLFTSHDSTRSNVQPFYVENRSLSGGSEYMRGRGAQSRQDVERANARSQYFARAQDSSFDTSESFSFFNNVADNRSLTTTVSVGSGRGVTESDSQQRDSGRGYGIAESRSTTQHSSRTQGRGEGESRMDSHGVTTSRHDVTAQDLSDIAKHLTAMYDANERDIEEYVRARNRMLFAQRYIERYMDGLCVPDDPRPYSARGDVHDYARENTAFGVSPARRSYAHVCVSAW